jgi:Acetyl-CoA hydrolase/transferase C-terminal domain
VALQTLLNRGVISAQADRQSLERLIEAGIVSSEFDKPSLEWLQRFGWLPDDARVSSGQVRFANGAAIGANLLDSGNRLALSQQMVGRKLRGGRFLHGAFYLGSKLLYDWLRTLDADDFEGVCMTRVSFINELYGGREALDIAQRFDPRFFNTCMMHTLSGAAVSDGLADGRVVSGVGGQYNFVAMAHAIPDGRSVLMLRSVREGGEGAKSNILWHYGHCTIPRHLRDIVITEYGIADLRGRSDEEVIIRLLAITDARFHVELIAKAKAEGKLARDFQAPEHWQRNTSQRLDEALKPMKLQGAFPRYPFGSDMDAQELSLIPALTRLKSETATSFGRTKALASALFRAPPTPAQQALLARVGLAEPRDFKSKLLAKMLAKWL